MSVLVRRPRLRAAALLVAVASAATGTSLAAQSTGAPAPAPSGDECLAFSFGAWAPPLDARAAGHRSATRADTTPQAPHGREWAMRFEAASRDSTLMLFPAWWPASVAIRLARGIDATSDTVRGTAVALVADGRLTAPRASVLLWRVPCGGGPRRSPPGPVINPR
jgi:hypothetical protein